MREPASRRPLLGRGAGRVARSSGDLLPGKADPAALRGLHGENRFPRAVNREGNAMHAALIDGACQPFARNLKLSGARRRAKPAVGRPFDAIVRLPPRMKLLALTPCAQGIDHIEERKHFLVRRSRSYASRPSLSVG